MIRAYKFLMRPTAGQAGALSAMLRDHCSLYNGALQERRDAYRHASKTSIKYGQQSAQLKEIRAFDPERHGRWSFSSQQATLRRLDKAFAAFFRRIKSGDTPGYPRFRGGELVRHGGLFQGRRRMPLGLHRARPRDPRPPARRRPRQGQPAPAGGRQGQDGVGQARGQALVRRSHGEQGQREPLSATGSVVGIDMGIASFLTTSNGEHVANPRHARKAAAKLEAAQHKLSRFGRVRRAKQTANHRKAVQRVADLHRKVRRQRLDHAHKTALDLVRDHDLIAHEDLKIRNMVKTATPKPDPEQPGVFLPNGVAAKRGLNRSISDAGWGGPDDPARQG